MHTQLLEEKEITSRARKACEDVFQICSAGDTITQGGFHRDPVQTLLMRRGANSDHLITPIIESAAIQAEMGAAGAGELFLRMFSTFFRDEIARKAAGLEPDPEWHQVLEKIRENSIPARRKDLSSVFSSTSVPFERIMKKCFDEIKADDKVMVRKVASSSTTVSRETGYTFVGLNIDPRFLSKGTWIRRNVRSFLIDGVIENVSEIHHMLEDISKKRVPAVIFCIDALPDITETLVKNFVMGNLDAVLVKVPVTEFHVNSLADLGTIFGLEPISAAKGDSISLGLKDQNTISDRVVISRSQVAIEKISTRDAVRSHVLNLRKRIDDDMNLAHILEPRIGRMSSSTTKIDVGIDDMRSDPNIVERLDRSFRSLSKILKFGFIEKSDFEGFSSDKISLLFGKNHAVPAEMAYQSIKIFLSTREAIQSAAAGIKSI